MLALAVVVGILVDDAIVEVENIERHSRMGKPIAEAVGEAVTEIALAVTATTMSLVAVFLPTAFMGGVPGLLFKQFGWTAVAAVLASLLVARLLTPLMAARWLRTRPAREKADGRVMAWYLSTVRWCLGHRRITAAAATLAFVASVALIPFIPTGLIPPSDSGFTTANIELPPGSSIENTLRVAAVARQAIRTAPGVNQILTTVGGPQQGASGAGGSAERAGAVRNAALIVKLAPHGERAKQGEVENTLREKLAEVPGARFHVGSGRPGETMELILASDNAQALKASAEALQRQLLGVKGLANISTTASLERPEIIVRPDLQRAADLGVTTGSIGDAVRVATSGDFDAGVARLNLDNRQVYIRARMSDAALANLTTLDNMRVDGKAGPIALSSVANLSVNSGPSEIDRYDRHRYITVDADLGGTALGAALAAAKAVPAAKAMPSSVKLIDSGDAETQNELASDFGLAIIVGVLCVFCVLVLLFKDFLQPITILSALPLSFGGAFLGLLVARSELDLPAFIGLIMLMGIVSKNSILLVEYTIVGLRDRGRSLHDAILEACHARARPVVMTTAAMTAGMAPMVLGFSADSSFREPMAAAVIGGLLSSTGLSLIVVPVVFTYVHDVEQWLRRRIGDKSVRTGGEAALPHPAPTR